jgi:SWIM zinc finger
VSGVEQVYRYVWPSTVTVAADRRDLRLATSGGTVDGHRADHPAFYDGVFHHPEQMAQLLLLVARVARTRFYRPASMVAAAIRAADPVVTSNGDRLRFESFSACCGVHARLDVLPDGLGRAPFGAGTTNVDVNEPLRAALATVGARDRLHLRIGEDLTVTTPSGPVTEVRVALPPRWLKGFAEVQLAAARAEPHLRLDAGQARRFVRSLPASTGAGAAPLWVVPVRGGGVRLATRPIACAVSLGGAERLRIIEPVLRFASAVEIFSLPGAGHGEPVPSIWVLTCAGARLTLTLSTASVRGFSGEGAVLSDLVGDESADDADLVLPLLAYEPCIDVARLAVDANLDARRVVRALGRLGAAGRVGYDVAEAAYFHRELPYDPDLLLVMHPRLRDAHRLVDAGAVRHDGDVALVRSGDAEHVVRGDKCTCPWYARHGTGRGPCKHVLAARIARND